ncbi:globin [Opisthorchis viverrini]|uniref:Globin n=1 Tax=Opisthorchis viverrini TaxID=6198 RepID=A0A1S8WJQ1_OPIVI|nr:globin [Opisthorchis viverrini]
MAPLTKDEVDAILEELNPSVSTGEQRTEFGKAIFMALFTAHPEYIGLFTKMEGLTKDNVEASEGIKYYGRTFTDSILEMLQSASDDGELEAVLEKSGKEHTTRNVTKQQFLSAEPVFIEHFKGVLTKEANKQSMEKFFKHIIPKIANHLD